MIPSIIDLFVKFCDPCLMCLSLCFNIFWFLYGISSFSRGCLWIKLSFPSLLSICDINQQRLIFMMRRYPFLDVPCLVYDVQRLSGVTSHSYMSLILMCMSCYQVFVDLNHDTRLADCTGNSSCRDHDVSWNMRHIILSCLFSSLILRFTKCCNVCFYQKLDMTFFCVPSYDDPYEWIDEFARLLFSITGMIHWPMLQLIMPWTSGSRDPARGAPRF
jgi:hypothetical protein